MKIGRAVLNTILASFGGSLAGGAAAGAVIAVASNFPDLSRAISVYAAVGGILIYLWGASVMAVLGAVGGPLLGFIPTLLLGTLLTLVRRLPPFQYLLVWAIAGALTGTAIYVWTPYGSPTGAHDRFAWGLGWAVGGATAMTVYWTAVADRFRRTLTAEGSEGMAR